MTAVVIPSNLGVEFDIGVAVANKISIVPAADAVQGKVALAVGANYPADYVANNDIDAVTPLFLKNTINAIPAVPNATDIIKGKVALAVGANYPADYVANNDIDAVTPLFLKNAINAIPAVGSAAPSGPAGGDLTGAYPNPGVVHATDTVFGISTLSVGANYPANDISNNDAETTTPFYVKTAITAGKEKYTAAAAAPVAPAIGDRWKNTSAGTVSGVPAGVTATWNGGAWDFVTTSPEGYTASTVAPVSPVIGDKWRNTSVSAFVAGVPPRVTATWNGAVWATSLLPFANAVTGLGDQALVDGVVTKINFPTAVVYLPDGVPALGAWAASVFTFDTDCVCLISCQALLQATGDGVGNTFMGLSLSKNGITNFTIEGSSTGNPVAPGQGNLLLSGASSLLLPFAAGDTLQLNAYISSTTGGAVYNTAGGVGTFAILRVA